MTAWIAGSAVSLDAAVTEAARLLNESRMPVIAGLATDLAGTRAAILLAEKLRGAYDHAASSAVLRDLDVMRQSGLMVTTPNELRSRADCVLLVGAGLAANWPAIFDRFELAKPAHFDTVHAARTIIRLGAGRNDTTIGGALDVAATPAALPQTLAQLRAYVAEHVRRPPRNGGRLEKIAAHLKAARFGVAVWSAETLDPLTIEMLSGMIRDLNKTTRFSGLPLAAPMNGNGVAQTSGWMTGFPMRTSFARGYPEHDSWRFDATRMVQSGETDLVLWISAHDAAPIWQKPVPLIALASFDAKFANEPRVRIDIGTPGLDHDGIEHAAETGTFTLRQAKAASDKASAAAVLQLIDRHIGEGTQEGAQTC